MRSEAKKRADNAWDAKAHDKITIRIRKDRQPTREAITAAAASAGLSLNEYILQAIKDKMQQ